MLHLPTSKMLQLSRINVWSLSIQGNLPKLMKKLLDKSRLSMSCIHFKNPVGNFSKLLFESITVVQGALGLELCVVSSGLSARSLGFFERSIRLRDSNCNNDPESLK